MAKCSEGRSDDTSCRAASLPSGVKKYPEKRAAAKGDANSLLWWKN